MLTKTALYQKLQVIIDQRLAQLGRAGTAKGIIPAAYSSGNPQIQRANESSTTVGTKTHRLVAPWSNRNGLKPTASQSIQYAWDADGNRVVMGPIVDASGVLVDADYILGLRPVAPGNTVALTASVEDSTNSASYVTAKRFFVTRPGMYRLKGVLSRTGGTTKTRIVIELPDGVVVLASSEATYTGTAFPTYGSQFSLDMTVPVSWGMFIVVQLLNDSGPAQTGYLKTCTLCYADATASLTLYDSVWLD